MQKVVIDTNVIVSALIGSGYPSKILYDLALNRKIIVCLSPEIFFEYVEVLYREKFSKYPHFVTNAEIVLNEIEKIAEKFNPKQQLRVIKDDPDNRFLELVVSANADFLITGNVNDFTFKTYRHTKIVTPTEYFTECFSEI